MKKLFTLALVMAVLSIGGVAFANDGAPAGKPAKPAKAAKVDLDKSLAELQEQREALVAKDANADTKKLDTQIDKLKAKIAKRDAKKAAKKADKPAATAPAATAAAPSATAETAK